MRAKGLGGGDAEGGGEGLGIEGRYQGSDQGAKGSEMGRMESRMTRDLKMTVNRRRQRLKVRQSSITTARRRRHWR